MSRLEHRIERDLRQIAERVTPSPDAWSSILTRISDQVLDDAPVPDTWSFTEEKATMIDVETRQIDEHRKGPKRVVAAGLLAAAAVVAIALVATRDDNATPADQPPSTVTVTPTVPPRPLRTMQDFDLLVPGTYFVDEVSGTPTPRIFVTVGAGWQKTGDFGIQKAGVSGFGYLGEGAMTFGRPDAVFSDACHWSDGYHPGPVTTLDGLVAALSEQGGWAEVTAPSDISIDGYAGKAFQRTAPADMSDCDTLPGYSPRIRTYGSRVFRDWVTGDFGELSEVGEIEILRVVDIDGTVVVITANLAIPTAEARAEFAAVLDSIRIDRA